MDHSGSRSSEIRESRNDCSTSVAGYFAIPRALRATGSICNGNVEVFF
jgi:hypothetical protein